MKKIRKKMYGNRVEEVRKEERGTESKNLERNERAKNFHCMKQQQYFFEGKEQLNYLTLI